MKFGGGGGGGGNFVWFFLALLFSLHFFFRNNLNFIKHQLEKNPTSSPRQLEKILTT